MRRPGRNKEELAGPQSDPVTGEAGQVWARSEDRVQARVEYRAKSARHLRGVEGPALLSGDEIHPEVRAESVNMKAAVGAGLQTGLTGSKKSLVVLPWL